MMQITIREPGSAITHYIGMMMALIAAVPLVIKASLSQNMLCIIAMVIFIGSMVLLYGASATYHAVNLTGKALKAFKKIDHMMIFVLIAGSYTPVCLLVLEPDVGLPLLGLVWGTAVIGMLIKLFWVTCPKWFSSIIYIAMGWECVLVFGPLVETLETGAFWWLLIGGLFYTVGGVIYALKIPFLNHLHKYFGLHEIFHLFIMAGSVCHFVFMFNYVI
ncbi:MAG: hemolysin III family protein [Lachnospiraceae bacterium]|nr:hemolysin III family protein [Lachnospiraceae bacterium]